MAVNSSHVGHQLTKLPSMIAMNTREAAPTRATRVFADEPTRIATWPKIR
jgi:hypothetical protein